jgi:hypothetical protein
MWSSSRGIGSPIHSARPQHSHFRSFRPDRNRRSRRCAVRYVDFAVRISSSGRSFWKLTLAHPAATQCVVLNPRRPICRLTVASCPRPSGSGRASRRPASCLHSRQLRSRVVHRSTSDACQPLLPWKQEQQATARDSDFTREPRVGKQGLEPRLPDPKSGALTLTPHPESGDARNRTGSATLAGRARYLSFSSPGAGRMAPPG